MGICSRKEHGEFAFNARVYYMVADLILPMTGEIVPDVDTTVVTVTDKMNNIFVGVAQCSPRDTYNKTLGREIAAGRLIKTMKQFSDGTLNDISMHQFDVVHDSGFTRHFMFGSIPSFYVLDEVLSIARDIIGPKFEDKK